MAVVSAVTGLLGADKQADAAEASARLQVQFAREGRDIANREADRGFKQSQKVVKNLTPRLNKLANDSFQKEAEFIRTGARQAVGFQQPFYDAGTNALAAQQYELGLGDAPEGYEGFKGSEGYRFRRQEAMDALQASAAASGGLFSAATMDALQERGDAMGAQEYDNHFNRLAGLSTQGQRAGEVMGQIRLQQGNALAAAKANQMGARQRNLGVGADARLNNILNRQNIRTQAGTEAASTIGNALANSEIQQGNAYQQGLGGINQGIQNTIGLFGAFG